ncbi:MAG: hypothetical protein II975_04500, partial [Bacteroidales bacterium]|nr:hypothetical protein [Bacteroidales bacterium]MBQ3580236.1 hypothetical protein [Bacteroidales bacterium]
MIVKEKHITMKINVTRLLFLFATIFMLTGCAARHIETAKTQNDTREKATLRGSVWIDDTGEPAGFVNVVLLDGKDIM